MLSMRLGKRMRWRNTKTTALIRVMREIYDPSAAGGRIMAEDYSELLKWLDYSHRFPIVEKAATVIRALVAENEGLRSELQNTYDWINSNVEVPTSGATARMIAIREALGETK